MYPILLKIGPLTLHTYGLMVAIGFLVAFFVARKEFDRRGISPGRVDDVALIAMIAGLFGARLMYALTGGIPDFWDRPQVFFQIWQGGLVFYGGALGGAIAVAIYARRREIPVLTIFDSLAAPLLIAHALGRVGCFAAGCCYGAPTDSILGVTFNHPQTLAPAGIALHPTQLYAAGGNLLLFLGAIALSRRIQPRGFVSAYYLAGYGLFRFVLEFVRDDFRGPTPLGLFPSQWIALASIAAGTALFLYVRKQR